MMPLAEEPTIFEAPDIRPSQSHETPKHIPELDLAALCQFKQIKRISPTKAEIWECPKLADYRILLPGIEVLIEDGDASNPDDWKPEFKVDYYCTKHFDQRYRYAPPPTPKLTFRNLAKERNKRKQ